MSTCRPHDSEADALEPGAVAGGIARPQQSLERPRPQSPSPNPGAEAPLVPASGTELGEFSHRSIAALALAFDRKSDGRGLGELVPEGTPAPDRARGEPELRDHGSCPVGR